jgi:hypothetical protein
LFRSTLEHAKVDQHSCSRRDDLRA